MYRDLPAYHLVTPHVSVVPPILPEESIWGYVMRVGLLNGLSGDELLRGLRPGAGTRKATLGPVLFPAGTAKLFKGIPHLGLTAQEALDNHSALPLFKWAHSEAEISSIVERFSNSADQPPSLQRQGSANMYPKHCPACARKDRKEHGFAYWRRLHQLRGMLFCADHCVPLVCGCGTCSYGNFCSTEQSLPSDLCACGGSQRPLDIGTIDETFFIAMARFAQYLMRALRTGPFLTDASGAVRSRLKSLGLASRNGRGAPKKHLQQLFAGAGRRDALDRLHLFPAHQTLIGICHGERRGPAGQFVAGMTALFGTFETYEAEVNNAMAERLKRQPSFARILRARYVLIDAAIQRDTLHRRHLGKSWSLKLLVTHDSTWIDAVLPSQLQKRKRRKAPPNPPQIDSEEDQRQADSIRRRAETMLMRPGKPERVTWQSLRRMSDSFACSRNLGPLAEAAKQEVVETTQEFWRRLLKWVATNRDAFATAWQQRDYMKGMIDRSYDRQEIVRRIIDSPAYADSPDLPLAPVTERRKRRE